MKCKINQWSDENGWTHPIISESNFLPDFILVFYSPGINIKTCLDQIDSVYPNANVLAISTGGEIFSNEVCEDTVCISAIQLEKTPFKVVEFDINTIQDSLSIGEKIGNNLNRDGNLNSVLIFSDGLVTNGTALINGLMNSTGSNVKITGGLAGDGDQFKVTRLGLDKLPTSNKTLAIGFYGENFVMGNGSAGGWDNFGPRREVTKSEGNVLFELDNQPALMLYKKYLSSEQIKNLPGSGLCFPLSINPPNFEEHDVVRTIVAIDESQQSLIFSGDIPQGYIARLMMGSFDRLIEGASTAAEMAFKNKDIFIGDRLNIMISCIGRKLLLGQQTEDEVDAVFEHVDSATKSIGFYSYGEISPHPKTGVCGLHNQTMTISLLGEME